MPFLELVRFLPFSQEPAIGPNLKPIKYSLRPYSVFFDTHFNIILYLQVFLQLCLSLQISSQMLQEIIV